MIVAPDGMAREPADPTAVIVCPVTSITARCT